MKTSRRLRLVPAKSRERISTNPEVQRRQWVQYFLTNDKRVNSWSKETVTHFLVGLCKHYSISLPEFCTCFQPKVPSDEKVFIYLLCIYLFDTVLAMGLPTEETKHELQKLKIEARKSERKSRRNPRKKI